MSNGEMKNPSFCLRIVIALLLVAFVQSSYQVAGGKLHLLLNKF